MNKQSIKAIIASLVFCGATLNAINIPATEDSQITIPKNTFSGTTGKLTTIAVSPASRGLVRFNLENLGLDSEQIESATLSIYVASVTKPGIITVRSLAAGSAGDWSEDAGKSAAGPTVAAGAGAEVEIKDKRKQFILLDATDLVKAWVDDGSTNNGIAIDSKNGVANIRLGAKEGPGLGYVASLEIQTNAVLPYIDPVTQKLDGSGLKPGSVSSASIASGAIGTAALGDGAVNDAKLADGSVTTPKIAAGAVTRAKITAAAVGTTELADAAVTATKLTAGAVGGNAIADGGVSTAKVADGAITSAKLATGAVGSSAIADGSVTTAKLGDLAVTSAKIATDAVGTSAIAANAVTGAKIPDGGLALSKLTPRTFSTSAAAGGIARGGSSGNFSITGQTTPSTVANMNVSLVTTGRPVFITMVPANTLSFLYITNPTVEPRGLVSLFVDGVRVKDVRIGSDGAPGRQTAYYAPGSFTFIENAPVTNGAHTYEIRVSIEVNNTTITVNECSLVAFEL